MDAPETALQENSVAMCGDGHDNDGDGHVDCEDQDCEIFAVCVRRPAAAPATPPAPAAQPRSPRPDTERPTRAVVPPGYRRADSTGMAILKVAAHATFWPGLLIGGIAGGFMIADGGDSCRTGFFVPQVCTSGFLIFGSVLAGTGLVLGTVYYVRRYRIQKRSATFALAPLVDGDALGLGGAYLF